MMLRWITIMYLLIAYLISLINSSIEGYHHIGDNSLRYDKQQQQQQQQQQQPLINDVVRLCELESLSVGTRLADHYGSFDENTEWDIRLHHDYLVQYLGFAGWIGMGLWKNTQLTASKQNAPKLQKKGGWSGSHNISSSAYWALQNKWLYMMGDSTQRQIWATFLSPFQSNDFERNAKMWTRENCARQYPHRKKHPSGGHFPEEGWGGKCGNNEVTCDLSGFGPKGRISFDWKHFSYEDYDEWLFGETGRWNGTSRHPEILVVHLGLHTCVHSSFSPTSQNKTMINQHKADLKLLMSAIKTAINRTPSSLPRTMVIIQLAGRAGNKDALQDRCTWEFNRASAYEAHLHGFAVFDRAEIERRILYKSEYWEGFFFIKSLLHLDNPAPNIVGTALLSLISCLERNGSDYNKRYLASDV